LLAARTILHVDMDAFYASVEQLDHPEWRGRPVIVGADPAGGRGRGVVAACSYEARAFGIRSALPIGQAWRLCPEGVFVRPRFPRYAELSERVFAILRRYTDLVEPLSIDEAFVDLTGSVRLFGPAEEIGREVKHSLRAELGLPASVGVAPNKFLAKIASELGKPDGLVVVPVGGEGEFLKPLPLGRLWGVGPKTEAKLRGIGLRTIEDLARLSREELRAMLGDAGEHLWELARGIDRRPVEPDSAAKSVGAETTFEADTGDAELVRCTLLSLADRVASRLRAQGLVAGGVTLKFRDEDFRTVTRSAGLPRPTDLAEDLYAKALVLLARVGWKGKLVRLVGITAVRLSSRGQGTKGQLELFGPAADAERLRRLAGTVDEIRKRFGSSAISRAALVVRKNG
jgi:DNA polymerase IV